MNPEWQDHTNRSRSLIHRDRVQADAYARPIEFELQPVYIMDPQVRSRPDYYSVFQAGWIACWWVLCQYDEIVMRRRTRARKKPPGILLRGHFQRIGRARSLQLVRIGFDLFPQTREQVRCFGDRSSRNARIFIRIGFDLFPQTGEQVWCLSNRIS